MSVYSKDAAQVATELLTDAAKGLTSAEAAVRLEKYGENRLKEKKKKSLAARFFSQFKDVMIIILIIAAIISFVVSLSSGEAEFFEPILILLIVILNAVLGTVQESRAEKALDALKSLSALRARVVRDGVEMQIDASQLVPGDLIKLEAGDMVPADARLVNSSSLKSEESALTGESVPAEKNATDVIDEDAPLGDRTNMVFSGCPITYGRADAIVCGTGMNTEMGKIAGLLSDDNDDTTPLQKRLAKLGKQLGIVALAACAVIFVVGLADGIPALEIFMIAVSLAVSAIPEGLPAIVTIALSVGVQRMAKRNAIIRRLPAVETLGSASVICSDKTGTLTQNRMTLVRAYREGAPIEDITPTCSEPISELLKLGTLCSDGTVTFDENEKAVHIGDPTETSIVYAAYINGMAKDDLGMTYPRLRELPFDSDRKLMTTVNQMNGKNVVIVKGAFESISPRCIKGDLETAAQVCADMSRDALRVLAIAVKTIDDNEIMSDDLESGLTFVGLLGMIDPPRPEARDAVAVCRAAGIKPVMITGDHVITASAIAKDLGILQEGDCAITGAELSEMTDEELDSRIREIAVYARVSPEDKIRIVRAWQRAGEVVSMTGDGVNDAPALRAADIGCAMGITGTDVAKGAADMTLTDDNFATIVDAVREGRGIYANIKKVVGFLLGTNIGEVFTVFFSMLLWRESPLLSMQLLLINLVTDGLPAIALGMEAVEEDVMNEKPKPKNEGIFAGGMGIKLVILGLLFSALTLVSYAIGVKHGGIIEGETMAFMTLALSQVFHSFNMRSNRTIFRKGGAFTNKKLNLAVLVSLVIVAIVLFTPVSVAFSLAYLPAKMYLMALGLSLIPIPFMEIYKLIENSVKKNKK